jgi:hypothetical protein
MINLFFIVIIILLALILLALYDINGKLPKRDYGKEALERDRQHGLRDDK